MPKKEQPLTFTDIVLRAEADVIQQAYEARVKIDELLAERSKAYEQIAQLEEQVDTVLGEAGTFPFPPPPMPVAGFAAKAAPANRSKARTPAKKSASASEPAPQKSSSAPAEESDSQEPEKPTGKEIASDDSETSR